MSSKLIAKEKIRFIRYPGGKQRLIDFLLPYLPPADMIEGRFVEPFVGGGAIFFALNPSMALLTDINSVLIDLYRGIRNYPLKVWAIFQDYPPTKKAYYKIRDSKKKLDLASRAARTLYLNRTCFKGMWRENSDGQFNVDYKGWELVEIYQESGVSGYKKDRPALEKLLKDAETGRFDVVIFPSIDRVGRSVKDVIEIDNFLRKHKVDTVFLREGVDTSTPTGALYRNIMSSVAEFEGRLIYERLSKGKREKASEGGYIGGWLPYGYAKDGNAVIVVKEEAEVIEQIFRWKAEGKTLQWICDRLNGDGIKTKRGGKWQVSTIRGILKNRFYTGRVEFEGTFIRAQHDAIISDVLFNRCNSDKTQ